MDGIAEKFYTREEYFIFCAMHEGRFEYKNGEIKEIPYDSVQANQIAGNIHIYLRNQLENKPYIFVQSAVKLQVKEEEIFRIPDFLIFKESGNKIKYATEPVLIVEVISESTAKTDRTTKLNEYRLLSSLQYYLIVEQESCFIEIYIREGERWYVEFYDKMDEVISLPYFDVQIPVNSIYKKVNFQPET